MCSPAVRSRCPDSEARPPLAGCTRSPAASSAAVSGCCASQSISSPGTSARSSRAIAMSRRAWPRPIGEDTKSARRGAGGARVQRRCSGRRAPSTRAAKSSISTFTLHGVARVGPVARPLEHHQLAAGELGDPPAALERRDAVAVAVDREHRAADAGSSASACSRVISPAGESFVCSSTERPASRPQPTQSSICFSEWGSGNISRNEELDEAREVPSPRGAGEARPALVGARGPRRRDARPTTGGRATAPARSGASAITPATRSGFSAAVNSAVAAPSDSPATSARSVPVASSTARASRTSRP